MKRPTKRMCLGTVLFFIQKIKVLALSQSRSSFAADAAGCLKQEEVFRWKEVLCGCFLVCKSVTRRKREGAPSFLPRFRIK